MNKEDKKAVEEIKSFIKDKDCKYWIGINGEKSVKIILNLIEKQQEKIKMLKDHNISQSKIILNMSERLFNDRKKIRAYGKLVERIIEQIKCLDKAESYWSYNEVKEILQSLLKEGGNDNEC